ncbi:SusC/RagA family TonB-linked outer membrane protein [Taibaiella koreensis]|uniref:SusC/RagA family TonB-linked outer membrane protein n=1 Tax=Taibaiella koreensis TaxID=1268548 RepID=UPI000E59EE7E|nr:TonB-dependent receptor [Taibaiella koreensis]
MRKRLLLLALFVGLGVQVALAQSRTVKGRVLDNSGDASPGSTVTVKGTQVGTVTDADGNFQLDLPEGSNTLIIKAVGAEDREYKITDVNAPIVVKMEDASQNVGEVEVYGHKVDKKSYTGSVASMGAAEIAKRPVTSIAKALDGAMPGVEVTSGGGQPGSSPDIQVRGQGSLSASSAPLIVLDGAPYSGSLVSINPNDVENMTVLKDATATSIYGARGANGVILITTKKGTSNNGKPRISLDASVGILNRYIPEYSRLGTKDYYETVWEGYKNMENANGNSPSSEGLIDFLGNYNAYKIANKDLMVIDDRQHATVNPNASLAYTDDWQKELMRTGIRQNYSLGVSNGDKKSDYYFSLGYTNDQGIVKNSSYERFTTRLTVNSQITSWLKAGVSLAGTYDNQKFFLGLPQPGDDPSSNAYSNPFFFTRTMGPIYPVYRYDRNGNRLSLPDGTPEYDFGENGPNNPSGLDQLRPFGSQTNAVASLFYNNPTNKALTGFGSTYLEAKFLKDFTARANFVLNYQSENQTSYYNSLYGDYASSQGLVSRLQATTMNYTFNQLLTWKPSFSIFAEDHHLELTVGHEAYLININQSWVQRSGFPSPDFQEGAAAAVGVGSGTQADNHAIESYLSQLNYNYKQRYFLSGSLRRDGSSRFRPKSRWGTFWSVGAGWLISEEEFAKGQTSWLNMAKIRGSYGISGNENLSNAGGANYYASLSRYSVLPNASAPGLLFANWGNDDLRWEGQTNFNVGFDAEFLNHRITATFDYFIRGSNALLYVRPLAPSTGSTGVYDNVGNMQNAGVELALGVDVVRTHDFTWNVRLNLTHLKNKITKVQAQDSLIGGGTILTKGLAVNSWFMPDYAGVDPNTGAPQWYIVEDANGNKVEQDGVHNITNDYQTAQAVANRKVFGSSFRDLDGSITNTFSYKGFDASFLVSFGLGGKFYDGNYAALMSTTIDSRGQALHSDILKAWKEPGDNTDVPRVDFSDAGQYNAALSSRFLISNSFLAIKNINIGYTFPTKWLKNVHFESARIYVAADNVHMFAARKGVDVKQAFFGQSSYTYFPYRTYMVGVQLGL